MLFFPLTKQSIPPKQNRNHWRGKKKKQKAGLVSKNVFSITSLPTIKDSALLKPMQCLYTLWL